MQKRYLYGTSSGTRYELTSNPFVSAASATASSEPTMGWEVTAFDGGGRLLSKQTFDGSSVPAPWGSNANTTGKVTTSYNAQITTVTDQAGNARQQWADGLGRVVEVIEDPGSSAHLNYVTNYSYDALDDLTQVAQGSETRTFSYDSLKRLRSA